MPLSEKQKESFRESDAKINIWEGSVRSGKTFVSLLRFITEVKEGGDGDYAIICKTYDGFKKNLKDIIFDFIGANSKYYVGKREIHIFGKTVHIIGADDERSEGKLRGATFRGAYVDEISLIPKSVWYMLISRCTMGGARIFGTTNPDSPFHWLKTDFLNNNPDVKTWQFRLDDNPELTFDEKEYLKRQYRGLWYQRFVEGLWVQAEGSIYDTFDTDRHVIDFAPGTVEYYIMGVDYGTSNPCSFVLIGVNSTKFPNRWIEAEYYYDSKVCQRQKTDSEYAEDLKRFIKDKPIKAIYIDPSAASFKLELQKQGVNNLYDAENEVIDGIRYVAALMNNGTFKICRSCTHLINEMQSYVWDPKSQKTGIDKPLKEHDHALDAMRYAMYTHFFAKDSGRRRPEDIDHDYIEAMGYRPNDPFSQPSPYI